MSHDDAAAMKAVADTYKSGGYQAARDKLRVLSESRQRQVKEEADVSREHISPN